MTHRIQRCRLLEQPGWLELRLALWPQGPVEEHREEMARFLAEPSRYVQFVAYAGRDEPVGLAEAAIRSD